MPTTRPGGGFERGAAGHYGSDGPAATMRSMTGLSCVRIRTPLTALGNGRAETRWSTGGTPPEIAMWRFLALLPLIHRSTHLRPPVQRVLRHRRRAERRGLRRAGAALARLRGRHRGRRRARARGGARRRLRVDRARSAHARRARPGDPPAGDAAPAGSARTGAVGGVGHRDQGPLPRAGRERLRPEAVRAGRARRRVGAHLRTAPPPAASERHLRTGTVTLDLLRRPVDVGDGRGRWSCPSGSSVCCDT